MLNRLTSYLLNSLLCLLYHREYQAYIKTKNIENEQRKKLLTVLRRNQNSEYGKKNGFHRIKNVEDFQKRVPLTDYEDYQESIEKIKAGIQNVLTCEEVLLLEPTSGSSSIAKLIPYTASLKEEFQSGLKPWLYDLYTRNKGLKWGRSYWAVTPATFQKSNSVGGIPIGFEEDSDYFGALEKRLMDRVFAVPSSVAKVGNMEEFYHQTVYHLLLCPDITLISVWNPTFLILLLEYMEKHVAGLVKEVAEKNRKRGAEVAEILKNRSYHQLWKNLKVISCWCDANAASHSRKLAQWFPEVVIQPKGLLATEGFVSFPLAGEVGARLSVKSHFFEFRSLTDDGIYLAHQLKQGELYEVILTTGGGFYRYQLHDIIEVVGFSDDFPRVVFKGKANRVSDLFGEKLHETFVKALMEEIGLNADFWMMAPETDRYVLYLEASGVPVELKARIEDGLRNNIHYDYCRKLGQLKELRIFLLQGNPRQEYLEECFRRGQRLGDIKTTSLHLQSGWDLVFTGEYQTRPLFHENETFL